MDTAVEARPEELYASVIADLLAGLAVWGARGVTIPFTDLGIAPVCAVAPARPNDDDGTVEIEHVPVKDTEDTASPRLLEAEMSIRQRSLLICGRLPGDGDVDRSRPTRHA